MTKDPIPSQFQPIPLKSLLSLLKPYDALLTWHMTLQGSFLYSPASWPNSRRSTSSCPWHGMGNSDSEGRLSGPDLCCPDFPFYQCLLPTSISRLPSFLVQINLLFSVALSTLYLPGPWCPKWYLSLIRFSSFFKPKCLFYYSFNT